MSKSHDASKPRNGTVVDWEAVEIACPRCGETRLIEPAGQGYFCNVCAKTFTLRGKDIA